MIINKITMKCNKCQNKIKCEDCGEKIECACACYCHNYPDENIKIKRGGIVCCACRLNTGLNF